jgi:hypothetical protein
MANGTHTFDFDNSAARLRFFLGQVLTQRDLEAEQRYHVMLQRLVQREAFGTGTAVGLGVSINSSSGGVVSQSVFVSPGLAFDPDGRELILEREVTIAVAAPLQTPEPDLFGSNPTTLQALADATADRFLGADLDAFTLADLNLLAERLVEVGFLDNATDVTPLREAIELIPAPDPPTAVPVVTPPELLSEWLFDQIIGTTFLGLAYRETGTAPAPATLDASCCGDRVCFASRTQEGVTVVASSDAFPQLFDPSEEFKATLDANLFAQIETPGTPAQLDCHAALCAALVSGRPGVSPWRGVPRVTFPCGDSAFPIVPLARIFWQRFDPGDSSPQILSIDNCTFRPLAPGVPALRALVESLTQCTNPPLLAPRVVSISPADGAEVLQVDTDPNPPSGNRFSISATFNTTVDPGIVSPINDQTIWEILFYPAAGNDDFELFVSSFSGGGPDGPGGTKVDTHIESTATISTLILDFADGAAFTPGTYVWRILNGADTSEASPNASSALLSTRNSVQLDGEPHPQGAVPSGDGKPGGVFEARFFIRV